MRGIEMRQAILVFVFAVVFAAAVAILFWSAAFAHSGATGIVKQRMDAMKSVAASMKAIAKADWSQPASARVTIATEARAISRHAAQIVILFPEGSGQHPTEASDAIWSDAEGFAAEAEAMKRAASNLAKTAATLSNSEDVAPHLQSLGQTCKSCHADYRVKR